MDYFERIAGEWYERAPELAEWVMAHLVNRTDVWGGYTRRKLDKASRAVTVPFRDERGKVYLDADSLRKHFRTRQPGGQLGIHSAASDLTSRWLAIDIDLHEDDDSLSVSQEGNLAAREAVARLRQHYRVVVYSARCRTSEGRTNTPP